MFAWFKHWWQKKKLKPKTSEHFDARNPPAIYWPEVQQFLTSFRHIVEENTKDNDQYKIVNEQILNYLEHQIELKGSIGTPFERVQALEILADRVLTTTMPKLVGLKPQTTLKTDYSDLVNIFKKELQERKEKSH